MSNFSIIRIASVLIASLSFVSVAGQTETFYAKNTGDWNNVANWTEDASGSVYTNSRNVIPGITAGFTGSGVDVKIHSNKMMTATVPALDGEVKQYINIDNLALFGQLNIKSLSPLKSNKFKVNRITGTGKLVINTTDVFNRLEIPAMLQDFEGEVVADNADLKTFVFANLNPGATVTEMPKSTIKNGTATIVSDYKIKGDLTIEEGATLYIAPGVTLNVEGDLIIRGKIYDGVADGISSLLSALGVSLGTDPARVVVGGSLINEGEIDFTKNRGVIVEYTGDNESSLELNNTKANNKFYQIVCNKTGNGKVSIYNNGGNGKALMLSQANIGASIASQPIYLQSGTLSLGYGVTLGTGNYWCSRTDAYTDVPSPAVGSRAGNLFIASGTKLVIDGADISVGPNSAVFIDGELEVNDGSFTTGEPGLFYVNIGDDKVYSKMTINGGTVNATRVVGLKTPCVHTQNGGSLHIKGTARTWGSIDNDNLTIKSIYLCEGSQLILKGGDIYVENDATGGHADFVHILFGQLAGSRTSGGTVYIQYPGVTNATFGNCNDLVIKSGSTFNVVLANLTDQVNIGGNLTVENSAVFSCKYSVNLSGSLNVQGSYVMAGGEPSICLTGKKNATYNTVSNINWKDLTIDKDKGYKMTATTPIRVTGDVSSNSGSVDGSVVLCGASQTLSEYSTGLTTVDIAAEANGSSIKLGSDVEIRSFTFNGDRVVELGMYNLKIQNYPTNASGSFGLNRSFRVPAENTASARGLSLPVMSSAANNKLFPMSVNGKYTYVQVLYTSNNNDYVTVVPVDGKHPAVSNSSGYLDFYWKINSTCDAVPSGNSYKVIIPSSCNRILENVQLRYMVRTDVGWYRGGEPGHSLEVISAFDWRYKLNQEQTFTSMPSISGDFTMCESTEMNGNLKFVSSKSGNWDEAIWEQYDQNGYRVGGTTLYSGKDINSSLHNVEIKHNVEYGSSETACTAGVITIQSGAKFIISESNASNLKAVSIEGEGTLQYDLNGNENFKIANASHTTFFNEPNAKLILNFGSPSNALTKKWNLAVCSAFPNTTVTGSTNATLKLTGTHDLEVRGDLNVTGGVTFDCRRTDGDAIRDVVMVQGNLNVGATSSFVLTNSTNQGSEFVVYGDVVNEGTISGGVAPVYLWGSVANNGTIDITSNLVYFWGADNATVTSNIACNGFSDTKKNHFGNSVIIKKETKNVKVDFQTRVWTGDDSKKEFNVDIQRGILSFNHGCDQILTQYPSGYQGDFSVPEEGALYSSGGCNVTVRVNDLKDKDDNILSCSSLYLGGELNISGTSKLFIKSGIYYRGLVYSTSAKLQVKESEFNTRCITPSESGSAIDLTLSNNATINCKAGAATQTLNNVFGVFDIRNGIVKFANSTVNINDVPQLATSVPALYYNPKSSTIDATAKIAVNYNGNIDERPFMIQATKALGSLQVSSSACKLYVDDLVLNGDLVIDEGKTLDANNLNITVKRNMTLVANAKFINDAITYLSSSNQMQTISLGRDAAFNKIVVNSAGVKTTGSSITVSKELAVEKGTLTVGGSNRIKVIGDLSVAEGCAIAGNGVTLGNGEDATAVSNLYCEGSITTLDIDTKKGVDMSSAQTQPLVVKSKLMMTRGVLDVMSNKLQLVTGAAIQKVGSDYSVDKMVSTNGSYTDNGIQVDWAINEIRNFELPLGKKGKCYTPVILDNMLSTTGGNMTFSSNDEIHYKVKEGIDKPENSDKTALNYYWYVSSSSGFTLSSGLLKYRYPKTEDDTYYTNWYAKYLDNSELEWKNGSDATGFDVVTYNESPYIELSYDKVKKEFNGVYTAYNGGLSLDNIPIFVAETSGDWNGKIWRKYKLVKSSSTFSLTNKASDLSKFEEGAVALIGVEGVTGVDDSKNVTVTMTDGSHMATFVQVCKSSTLNVKKTINNNFFNVYGRGTLKVEGPSALPSARYDLFFVKDGGTIEYGSDDSESDTYTYTTFDNLTVNNVVFSGKGTRELRSSNNVKALGNVTVNGSNIKFMGKDFAIEGNLTINGGSFLGSGNVTFSGTSATQTISSDKGVTEITLPGITVNKSDGKVVVSNISKVNLTKLKLTSGILQSDDNEIVLAAGTTVTGGGETSYVDGILSQNANRTGSQMIYPLGNGGTYAKTPLIPYTTGIWKVRYFHADPPAGKSVAENDAVKGHQYWKVVGPSDKSVAKLGMRWISPEPFAEGTDGVITLEEVAADNIWEDISYSDYSGDNSNGTLVTEKQTFNATSEVVGGEWQSDNIVTMTVSVSASRIGKDQSKSASYTLSVPEGFRYTFKSYTTSQKSNGSFTSEPAVNSEYPAGDHKLTWTFTASKNSGSFTVNSITFSKEKYVENRAAVPATRYFAFRTNKYDGEYRWTGNFNEDWTEEGNWNLGKVPNSSCDVHIPLTVNKPVISDGNKVYAANLTIDNGSSLTLSGSSSLTVTGDITNNGVFYLNYSYNENPNFYYHGNLTGNKFTVNREFETGRLYYTGSATTEREISGFSDGDAYAHFTEGKTGFVAESGYDSKMTGSSSYAGIPGSATVLGLLAGDPAAATRTLTQYGTVAKDDEEFVVTLPKDDCRYGYTWLSQPYPYNLDITGIKLGTNAHKSIYIHQNTSDNVYATYNADTKVCTNEDVRVVAPFQVFAVGNESTTQTATITFDPTKKASSTTNLKSATIEENLSDVLRIVAYNSEGSSDETVVVFRDGGDIYLTDSDSKKVMNSGSTVVNLYTVKETQPVAIALYPDFELLETETEIPLVIAGNTNSVYLRATNIFDFDDSMNVFLLDTRTGVYTNLRRYPFIEIEDISTLDENSLKLVFKPRVTSVKNTTEIPTDTKEVEDNVNHSIMITSNKNVVTVNIFGEVKKDAIIVTYDTLGRIIVSSRVTDNKTTLSLDASGVFVVEVINGEDRLSKKVLLR